MTHLPSVFVSHGAPTFAIEPGRAGPLLRQLALSIPRPRAVLVFSPHWMTEKVEIGFAQQPETIHDFGGFPEELYRIQYPAPGSPEVAARAVALLESAGWPVLANARRGLDHGAWVPVRHLFPDADVPVLQVSMPHTLDGPSALALGRALAPLAQERVLIVGSGSLTHNLGEFRGGRATEPAPYALEFVQWARNAVLAHDGTALANYLDRAPHAARAHPSSDHYLPLPFAFGASQDDAPVHVIDGGILYGMLSMEAYVFGGPAVQ